MSIKNCIKQVLALAFATALLWSCAPSQARVAQEMYVEETTRVEAELAELKPPILLSPDPLRGTIFTSGESASVKLKGLAKPGATVVIEVNGRVVEQVVAAPDGRFSTKTEVNLGLGRNTVSLYAVEASVKSKPTSVVFQVSSPEPPRIDYPADGEVLYTNSTQKEIFVRGRAAAGSKIEILLNGKVMLQVESDQDGVFETESFSIDPGQNVIAARSLASIEGKAFYSPEAEVRVRLVKDLTKPEAVVLSASRGSNQNVLRWTESVSADFAAYKVVRSLPFENPDIAKHDVLATIAQRGQTQFKDTPPNPDWAYYYAVFVVDKAGNLTSSNVVDVPKIQFGLALTPLSRFADYASVPRNNYWYSEYELKNTGNVKEKVLFDYKFWTYPGSGNVPNPGSWYVKLWEVGGGYIFESEGLGAPEETTPTTTAKEETTAATTEKPLRTTEVSGNTGNFIELEPGASKTLVVKVFNNYADEGDVLVLNFTGYVLKPLSEEKNTIVAEVSTGNIFVRAGSTR